MSALTEPVACPSVPFRSAWSWYGSLLFALPADTLSLAFHRRCVISGTNFSSVFSMVDSTRITVYVILSFFLAHGIIQLFIVSRRLPVRFASQLSTKFSCFRVGLRLRVAFKAQGKGRARADCARVVQTQGTQYIVFSLFTFLKQCFYLRFCDWG